MKRLKTTVSYKVPVGKYCNHNLKKSTPLTRCRFCTDLGKGLFVCMLHNEPLTVSSGIMIHKADDCLAKKGIVEDKPVIESKPALPAIPTKEIMKYAITQYKSIYNELLMNNIPDKLAQKYAMEEVLK